MKNHAQNCSSSLTKQNLSNFSHRFSLKSNLLSNNNNKNNMNSNSNNINTDSKSSLRLSIPLRRGDSLVGGSAFCGYQQNNFINSMNGNNGSMLNIHDLRPSLNSTKTTQIQFPISRKTPSSNSLNNPLQNITSSLNLPKKQNILHNLIHKLDNNQQQLKQIIQSKIRAGKPTSCCYQLSRCSFEDNFNTCNHTNSNFNSNMNGYQNPSCTLQDNYQQYYNKQNAELSEKLVNCEKELQYYKDMVKNLHLSNYLYSQFCVEIQNIMENIVPDKQNRNKNRSKSKNEKNNRNSLKDAETQTNFNSGYQNSKQFLENIDKTLKVLYGKKCR